MNRMKRAGGMLVGAIALHVLAVACSAVNTTGMLPAFLDSGTRADTGVMGGHDAAAQTMPCAQWEVKYINIPPSSDMATTLEAGWEPYGVFDYSIHLRRCRATTSP